MGCRSMSWRSGFAELRTDTLGSASAARLLRFVAVTSPYKSYVVVNPKSAHGGTGKRWREISAGLNAALGEGWSHGFTEAPGDATRIVRRALRDGHDMIVAVGGDGTINEVINGFFDGEKPVSECPVLGLIGSGTGGDFRKTWGFSRDVGEATARLAGDETRPVDVGRIRWTDPDGTARMRYFANIASFGMSALVSKTVNERSKILGGRASFFLASAESMFRYRKQPIRLTTDGAADKSRVGPLTVGTCCIGRYFGGGMMIGAEADPSDGLFDVVSLNTGPGDLFRMTRVYKGKHLGQKGVEHWRGAVVEAAVEAQSGRPAAACFIEADGEVFGQLPARFEVVPGVYRIKV